MKSKKIPFSQADIKKMFDYNPVTGILSWRISPCPRIVTLGIEAGSIRKDSGYRQVKIHYANYFVHRIIFLWMEGCVPDQVDHSNHIRNDNRWTNLQASTHANNMRNLSLTTRNTSGHVGVTWHKRANKWQSHIKINNKHIHLGLFNNIENAACARLIANNNYGFHQNHGKPA